MDSKLTEFDIIKKYFAPLAAGFSGSFGLSDDAAVFSAPPGHELVITKDAIAQSVHFIGTETADLIAAKALRVNLSDLAAMGATPICYFLALALPRNIGEEWIEKFAKGLRETQEKFHIQLAGGDTIATDGTLTISITAVGSVPSGQALRRNGAKPDDDIFVSGTLGDSALGLKILQSGKYKPETGNYLVERYLLPQPRLELGQYLRGVANSVMDISDGLLQDLGHICKSSKVGAVIYGDKIPLSQAAKVENDYMQAAISGGDDYELLFTMPKNKYHLVPENCTRIGEIVAGSSVILKDRTGNNVIPERSGFSHF